MPRHIPAPEIPGLVASTVTVGTWCGDEARSWCYHHPSDCRPLSKRIAVFVRDDGLDSHVKLIEGDGRSASFVEHARRNLPEGATLDIAVTVASEMASQMTPSPPTTPEEKDERLVAGILTANGFLLDDFYGQTAWLKESNIEGFKVYVRGTPAPQFVEIQGRDIAVPLTDRILAEMPVEVGISSDYDKGNTSCIAPCLEEGVRVILEGMLPHPAEDEVMVFDYEKLVASKPVIGRTPKR
ncbi:hypothetical protein [Rhizobium sp. BK176]|uniref:hypothetical protein n=1 Tax=Rhizobium sp. BK176 TaxID=2587071 RepID=UPI00216788E9|nr:hypothetical protein [Rhizobium sp. BK176]MCS4089155.1 hypothetical protein [Rhizobium sp. BK176]